MTDKPEENFTELLNVARQMTTRNIRIALKQRNAMHLWAIRAYEAALNEKPATNKTKRQPCKAIHNPKVYCSVCRMISERAN